MEQDIVLGLHIAAGSIGLAVGPVAMAAHKTRGLHVWAGRAYQAAVATMALTAVILVTQHPGRLWGFAVIAVATEAAALTGWLLARHRPAGWLPVHVGVMLGSYLSLCTALLVVNAPNPVSWVAPTIVGTPLIALTARRAARRAAHHNPQLNDPSPERPSDRADRHLIATIRTHQRSVSD